MQQQIPWGIPPPITARTTTWPNKRIRKGKFPLKKLANQGLSPERESLWDKITAQFEFSEAELAILRAGLEALDRCQQAKGILDREGITVTDRWKQVKPHPAVNIERDNRSAFISAMRTLKLNTQELD